MRKAECSALHEIQKEMRATFAEYHGWKLPRAYTSVEEEYRAARTSAVVMDRSSLGRLIVRGNDALDLLHRLTTNNLKLLKPGEGMSAALTTAKGRIVDHLVVYMGRSALLLLTSPQNRGKVARWLEHYTFIEDVKVEDVTTRSGMIFLFGPQASQLTSEVLGQDVSQLPIHHQVALGSEEFDFLVARSEPIEGEGFNIIAGNPLLQKLWQTALEKGAHPIGEEAFDILRVEYGIPAYGKELSEAINPLEARLNDSISFNKGCYIGQEVIARLNTYKKVQKCLTGFLFPLCMRPSSGQSPEPGARLEIDERDVGFLTSAVMRPGGEITMALGYIRVKYAIPGTKVYARGGGGKIEGQVVAPPFPIQVKD